MVLAASALGAVHPLDEANPGVSQPLGYPLEALRVMEIDPRTFARGSNVTTPGTFLGIADRIDHIFVSSDIQVGDARYLINSESDHPAMLVEIEW